MIKEISAEEALNIPGAVIADVRSEGEFEEGTIPGAVNIPLLDNGERARVGTEYRRVSPHQARRTGLEIVSPKLVKMVGEFDQLAGPGKKVVVFCWRGGMRSQFVTQMLDLMGFDVYRVKGGYKAYRRYVRTWLERELPHRAVVLHGLTGVGKTMILNRLAEEGMPVLDLEGLAVHRGSVFGKVGLPQSPPQKSFESLIFRELKRAEQRGVFIVECESRRLGRLLVPDSVLNAMKKGYRILLYAPLAVRVERSLEVYTSRQDGEKNIRQLMDATGALVKYLGHKKVDQLNSLIKSGQLAEAVEILLTDYYDPLYKYPDKADPDYDLSVDTTDIELSVKKIRDFVVGLAEYNVPITGGVPDGNREYT